MNTVLHKLNEESLVSRLGLPMDEFRRLVRKAPHLYRCRHEPKKNCGTRTIEAPHPNLKAVQRELLHGIIGQLRTDPMLYGGRGSSVISALRPHVGRPMVVTLDIKDFFPSVSSTQVFRALKQRGASHEIADMICRLTTRKGRLPQGAPTSPALARLVLTPVARRIRDALAGIGAAAHCSIYVDDVTLSGPAGLKRFKGTVVNIVQRHGFKVHPSKVHIMPTSVAQESLGCRINTRLEPSQDFQDRFDAAIGEEGIASRRVQGMAAWRRRLLRSCPE